MKAKWKARAIYTAPGYFRGESRDADIDIVHDRQSWEGDQDEAFLTWLNKEALPALKKWATTNRIPESSREVFELRVGNKHLRATPNGSYGYMYIEASMEEGNQP